MTPSSGTSETQITTIPALASIKIVRVIGTLVQSSNPYTTLTRDTAAPNSLIMIVLISHHIGFLPVHPMVG